MKLTVLGCSGGIGSGRHTTCFLVDDDILIDAGTGITTLDFDSCWRSITCSSPMRISTMCWGCRCCSTRGRPARHPAAVHALPEVLEVLSRRTCSTGSCGRISARSRAPTRRGCASSPWRLAKPARWGASFIPLPVNHVVPACGFRSGTARAAWCSVATPPAATPSSPRSTPSRPAPSHRRNLVRKRTGRHRAGFEASLARFAGGRAGRAQRAPEVWITHLKPGNEAAIMDELRAAAPGWGLAALYAGAGDRAISRAGSERKLASSASNPSAPKLFKRFPAEQGDGARHFAPAIAAALRA